MEIQQGDVVVLKSGGPKMTVASADAKSCLCQWFQGDNLREGSFPSSALTAVKEAKRQTTKSEPPAIRRDAVRKPTQNAR